MSVETISPEQIAQFIASPQFKQSFHDVFDLVRQQALRQFGTEPLNHGTFQEVIHEVMKQRREASLEFEKILNTINESTPLSKSLFTFFSQYHKKPSSPEPTPNIEENKPKKPGNN